MMKAVGASALKNTELKNLPSASVYRVHAVPAAASRGQKIPPELELLVPCSCWKLNTDLWKSNHSSELLSHLSSPPLYKLSMLNTETKKLVYEFAVFLISP